MKVKFSFDAGVVTGELVDNHIVREIARYLPIKETAKVWGRELYFFVEMKVPIEDGKELVSVGDITYWPDGPAICLFFGPTPISRNAEIRAYSPVSVIGRLDAGYAEILEKVKDGDQVTMAELTKGGA